MTHNYTPNMRNTWNRKCHWKWPYAERKLFNSENRVHRAS